MKISLWTPDALAELMEADRKIFPSDDRWEERLRDYATRPQSYVFVATEDSTIVGYVLSWVLGLRPHILHIPKLGVEQKYRNKGIGRRLLKAAIMKARRDFAVESVTLHVSTTNIPAYALYTSLGFRTEKIVEDYYGAPGKDAFKMRLWRF